VAEPGIGAYAAHLPAYAVATTTFGKAVAPADARRARSTANHDEDSLTLAVEAARHLASDVPANAPLFFGTSEPPYLDKSSASTLHAALDLPASVHAADLAGLRAGAAVLASALATGGTGVAADVRTQAPGAPDELAHGDAAFAFVAGGDAATLLAHAAVTTELLDRRRLPGDRHPVVWDERFTAEVYLANMTDAVQRAFAEAGIGRADHVVVSCANGRAAAAARGALGAMADAELEALVGHTGAAHLGLLLADALDRAQPGETILALGAADGADAFVFRAGAAVGDANRGRPVREQLGTRMGLTYERFLRRRRLLDLQGARRPDPEAPAAPPMYRNSRWKFGLVANRCRDCGTIATPPAPVCPECGATGTAEDYPLREVPGRVVSFTVDHLSPSPDPPVVLAVVDFDLGGRRSVEVTDVPEEGIAVGDRVVSTFRRLHSSGGIHNYFWKARSEDN
jgi:3-hydroxy-3-methylglutaryl CoA synthase